MPLITHTTRSALSKLLIQICAINTNPYYPVSSELVVRADNGQHYVNIKIQYYCTGHLSNWSSEARLGSYCYPPSLKICMYMNIMACKSFRNDRWTHFEINSPSKLIVKGVKTATGTSNNRKEKLSQISSFTAVDNNHLCLSLPTLPGQSWASC